MGTMVSGKQKCERNSLQMPLLHRRAAWYSVSLTQAPVIWEEGSLLEKLLLC